MAISVMSPDRPVHALRVWCGAHPLLDDMTRAQKCTRRRASNFDAIRQGIAERHTHIDYDVGLTDRSVLCEVSLFSTCLM